MKSLQLTKLRVNMTDAASMANVSYSTIQKDVSIGVLPAQRMYRYYYILISDLEEYVSNPDSVRRKRAAYYRKMRQEESKAS